MRAVIQRVREAAVRVGEEKVDSIGEGIVALVGVARDDTESDARVLAEKLAGLRIFPDSAGKMNLSVSDVGGAVLVISQFTLLANTQKGRRPSFVQAADPIVAEPLVELVRAGLESCGVPTGSGRFGAVMEVSLTNAGPVTIVLETSGGKLL